MLEKEKEGRIQVAAVFEQDGQRRVKKKEIPLPGEAAPKEPGSLVWIPRGPAVHTGLTSPHPVTSLAPGDLRVAAPPLEVLGRMPNPRALKTCAARSPLSDEGCLVTPSTFKMQPRCRGLFSMQNHWAAPSWASS